MRAHVAPIVTPAIAALALACSAVLPVSPAAAQDTDDSTAPVNLDVETASGLNGTISTPTGAERVAQRIAAARAITDAAFAAGFSGEIVIDMGGLLMVNAMSADLAEEGHSAFDAPKLMWPYASVTKQILAAKMVDELDAGDYSLDTPITEFVDGIDASEAPAPTIRQLLQHRSGLRNPDETPEGANGWPAFYNGGAKYGVEWCLKGRTAPPSTGWSYNNCDYMALGAAFDELSFEDWSYLIGGGAEGKNVAQVVITPGNASQFYKLSGPEVRVIPGYGASAALGGTLENLTFFNWDRMKRYEDDLASGGSKAAFWQGDPALGFMALGHWVFEVEHPACPAPIVVSQRKGEIGRYQLENIMLPELKRSMVFATAQSGFDFGEIWTEKGALYDAIGTLACGDKS
ncbi:MAG: serine hydrolase domain-containing protein [Pseudomonadota bacterium]